jgi:hypothetical protein
MGVSTDVMYDNVVNKFLWGGLDTAKPGSLYLDETISRMVTTMRSAMLDLSTALMNEGTKAKNGQLAVPAGMTQEAYVADRYKKAIHILDLMMEKLPIATSPFTVQMGDQVARIYYELGKASNNDACIKKGNDLLRQETLRYGDYIRFYQSLSPSMYDRLNTTDKFIDTQYMVFLLHDYYLQCGEAPYKKLMDELAARGVNVQRIQAMQRSYDEAMLQQQQAAQQQAEGESSAELEDILSE